MRTTADSSLPKPGCHDVKVYLPHSQRTRIIDEGLVQEILGPYYPHRIHPDALGEAAPESVMIFRPSMFRELQRAGCLNAATLVSSVWSGYVHCCDELGPMDQAGITRYHVHTSGHATVDELRVFVDAFPMSQIVPIHLEDREGFRRLSPNVAPRNDHDWWEV